MIAYHYFVIDRKRYKLKILKDRLSHYQNIHTEKLWLKCVGTHLRYEREREREEWYQERDMYNLYTYMYTSTLGQLISRYCRQIKNCVHRYYVYKWCSLFFFSKWNLMENSWISYSYHYPLYIYIYIRPETRNTTDPHARTQTRIHNYIRQIQLCTRTIWCIKYCQQDMNSA